MATTDQPKKGAQQILKLPPFRPGHWVKIRDQQAPADLAGRIRRVTSLTYALREGQPGVWKVHFRDGRCVDREFIQRFATEAEIQRAQAARDE